MNLSLLFTRGQSLKTWVDSGLFYREVLIYHELLKKNHCKNIFWFTYGPNDKELSELLKKNNKINKSIIVVGMPRLFNSRFGKIIYSLLLIQSWFFYGVKGRPAKMLFSNYQDVFLHLDM